MCEIEIMCINQNCPLINNDLFMIAIGICQLYDETVRKWQAI